MTTVARRGRRFVFHLGSHKTGTTSVQEFMRTRRRAMLDQGWMFQGPAAGVLFEPFERFRLGETDVAETLDGIRRASASLPDAHSLFVSNENLMGVPIGEPEDGFYERCSELAAVLAGAELGGAVEVVLIVRNQADLVESFYVQSVKQGGCRTFSEWFASLDPSSLRWTPVIESLRSRLAHVTVVPYESFRSDSESLIDWILAYLSIDLPVDVALRRNEMYTEQSLWLALLANHVLDDDDRRSLRKFLQSKFGMSGPRPRLLTPSGRNEILTVLADDNRELFRRYVHDDHNVARHYLPAAARGGNGTGMTPHVADVWPSLDVVMRSWRSHTNQWQ